MYIDKNVLYVKYISLIRPNSSMAEKYVIFSHCQTEVFLHVATLQQYSSVHVFDFVVFFLLFCQ